MVDLYLYFCILRGAGEGQERGSFYPFIKRVKKKSMGEWRVEGAKGKPGAGAARWRSRDRPGQGPRAESSEGGDMVEDWQTITWG